MAITSLKRDQGIGVNIVRMVTTDSLSDIAEEGYLTAQLPNTTSINHGIWEWLPSDLIVAYASDGDGIFKFNGDDFTTLISYNDVNGFVVLPVVSGNFTVFDGTLGELKDAGYSPSDNSKTKVIMASSSVIANHIACFSDTSGTVNDDPSTAINGGNIQAGLSGTAGYISSFPSSSSKGSLRLVAANNAGDTVTQITNASFAQASVLTIPDPGATGNICVAPAALSANNFLVGGSGAGGLVADSGYRLIFNKTLTLTISGTSQQYAVAGVTSDSIVQATVLGSTVPVYPIAVVPGTNLIDVTFSVAPGASTTLFFTVATPNF